MNHRMSDPEGLMRSCAISFDSRMREGDFDRAVAQVKEDVRNEVLARPPAGWFPFGHHVDQPDVKLEFWGEHCTGDGMPAWERPLESANHDE